ncbi:MAG: hypothetical protein K8H86_01720, partial [Ignavibacteriaceae bacterium]|nr:hypothetical protein [Ignavibacteriaceae bacterium]
IKIFNITNPAAPFFVSTISLIGNQDIAVKNSYMYADSYTDLIIYNIANPASAVIVDSIKNVFQKMYYGDPGFYGNFGGSSGCGCSTDEVTPVYATNNGGSGVGGSLARFAIAKNYLYCIDGNSLTIFNLAIPAHPAYISKINVGWDIETIYSYNNNLFIGGTNGMYIYSITDPQNPVQISTFTHARACDPVVVENNRAYVTLRSGTTCGPSENALHIIDITNISNPSLLKTVLMDEPYGLSVNNNIVYVCDGVGGIKILNAANLTQVEFLKVLGSTMPHDCILSSDILYVTAQDGIIVYNVANPASPVRLSMIR